MSSWLRVLSEASASAAPSETVAPVLWRVATSVGVTLRVVSCFESAAAARRAASMASAASSTADGTRLAGGAHSAAELTADAGGETWAAPAVPMCIGSWARCSRAAERVARPTASATALAGAREVTVWTAKRRLAATTRAQSAIEEMRVGAEAEGGDPAVEAGVVAKLGVVELVVSGGIVGMRRRAAIVARKRTTLRR